MPVTWTALPESVRPLVPATAHFMRVFPMSMTARELKPSLFTVRRKNRQQNDPLFAAFRPDLVMQPAQIIATECLAILTAPRLARFLAAAERRDEAWANELASRIVGISSTAPELWSVRITPAAAPAAWRYAAADALRVEHLLLDAADRTLRLPIIALRLERADRGTLLPDEASALEGGDVLLFCGTSPARARQLFTVAGYAAMRYVVTGEAMRGTFWRWLSRRPDRAPAPNVPAR